MAWTVFYAWQSDLPNSTNRGLIERGLQDAVKQLGADGSVVQDPRVDRDTLGVAGSPDIERTIFEKIAQAAVFVCDVSLVTNDGSGRPSPNPNVLIELGFALRALGDERVILVMNRAFGPPELLPFDIRRKRVLTYDIAVDAGEKARERSALTARLVEAVRLSMTAAKTARTSEEPTPAAALIRAVETNAPTRRSTARAYAASVLRSLDAKRPARVESDDEVVASIESLRGDVAEFLKLAPCVVAHDSQEVVEELLHLFEGILLRYDLPAGFSGTSRRTDFDYAKFFGHELFVGFVAAYVAEEKWESLDQMLREPLLVTGGIHGDRQVYFDRLSQPTDILDVVRRDRLREGQRTRVSLRADILKERYTAGPLAELLPWSAFMQADLLLYLRAALRAKDDPGPRFWFPWSSLYLRDLPVVLARAEGKRHAARLAAGLGVALTPSFGKDLGAAIYKIRDSYRETFWLPPGDGFDWSRIGTR